MKLIVTDDLKSRLINAAHNGSIIARDILAEIRSNADVTEIIRGTANYFGTKRKRSSESDYNKIKVIFTVCAKDITNPNFPDKDNPQAPWFKENRTDIEPSTFVNSFKNLQEYDNKDLTYFVNAITINSRVNVKMYDKMNDFIEAYTAENYSHIAQFGESSLHNSCMRYEHTTRNAADFYHNFAGAKIVVAKDEAGDILGRAILWPNVILKLGDEIFNVSVLDRVYYTHDFVIQLIYEYARSMGVTFRKQHNDASSPRKVRSLNAIPDTNIQPDMDFIDMHLYINVPASKWHKNGAPYLDTFSNVLINDEKQVQLSNKNTGNLLATLQSTCGTGIRSSKLCPKCGTVHSNSEELCCICHSEIFVDTIFGSAMICRTVTYNKETFPSILFHKGKPNENLKLYLQIRKLY